MSRSVFLLEWFDIVSGAMKASDEVDLTLEGIRDYFVKSGETVDGEPFDPASSKHQNAVTDALELALPWYERWNLVQAKIDRDRYTPNLRLHVPEKVGRLSKRGHCLAARSRWQRYAFFMAASSTISLVRFFKKFRVALAVIAVVLTLSKLVLEWGNIPAAGAAIVAGIVAAIVSVAGQSSE